MNFGIEAKSTMYKLQSSAPLLNCLLFITLKIWISHISSIKMFN